MIFRLIKIARQYQRWMLLSILFGFLTVGSGIGLMMTSAFIIASAALHPFLSELQVAIVGVRFFGISRGIFRYLERVFSHETTFRLLKSFRVWFYQALEPLAPACFLKFRSGDLLSRIVSDIENLEHVFIRVITPPIVAMLITVSMWILLGMFHWYFPLILTLFLILAGVGVPIFTSRFTHKLNREQIIVHSQLNQMAVDGVQGMAELLMFNGDVSYLEKFNKLNRQYVTLQKKIFQIDGLNDAFIQLLIGLCVFIILVLAIPLIHQGVLKGVYLSVVVLGAMAAFEAVSGLPGAFQNLEKSLTSAGRLFELIDTPVAVNVTNNLQPVPHWDSPRVTIENLTFHYPGEEHPVLNDVSLELMPGKALAVVGLSGAGKTTLWQLLVRFYDYQHGRIRLNGREVKTLSPEAVRQYFAVVPQNPILFSGTIRENLLLAHKDASEEMLQKACKAANIQDFIQSLPQGMDTYVGEQGFTISGGELQRIALARALLKNAPFLILDEPTANLDAANERQILQSIFELKRNKGILVISHRLLGLEFMDEIIVLEEGRLTERGTHQQLMERGGFYKHLIENQWQMMLLEEMPIS